MPRTVIELTSLECSDEEEEEEEELISTSSSSSHIEIETPLESEAVIEVGNRGEVKQDGKIIVKSIPFCQCHRGDDPKVEITINGNVKMLKARGIPTITVEGDVDTLTASGVPSISVRGNVNNHVHPESSTTSQTKRYGSANGNDFRARCLGRRHASHS